MRTAVQARDPKVDRGSQMAGRPAFGLGPIARVSTIPAPGYQVPSDRIGTLTGRTGIMPGRSYGRVGSAVGAGVDGVRNRAFGLPNLRRNVCPHFYVTGTRGALPIQAPHLLKALVRQDTAVSRCQLRGGVHLEQGYVNDVCLSPRFNQCVFYEEDLTRR
ncbi:MAG TPA: hypothetical protein VET90_00375 [Candidatus Binatus sp.]|nr:hypothetical protein [Candidatus Binatus sp.]